MVSQEMMMDVYVLGSRVAYGIVCKLNGTLIVTKSAKSRTELFQFIVCKYPTLGINISQTILIWT